MTKKPDTDDIQANPQDNQTTSDSQISEKPKRKYTRKAIKKETVDDQVATTQEVQDDQTHHKDSPYTSQIKPKETLLEFLQREDGVLVLREAGEDEPLVSIDFADKIKDLIGHDNIQTVGHHMIQAAIASFMQRQINQWHAQVYDEPPKHFS